MTTVSEYHAAQDAYYAARYAVFKNAVSRTGRWMSYEQSEAFASPSLIAMMASAKARLDGMVKPY